MGCPPITARRVRPIVSVRAVSLSCGPEDITPFFLVRKYYTFLIWTHIVFFFFFLILLGPNSFGMALPCERSKRIGTQCNPDGNCAYRWGQSFENITCKICGEGSKGRMCSKCDCDGMGDSCRVWMADQCLPCPSTRLMLIIVFSVLAALFVIVFFILFLASVKHQAMQELKDITTIILNSGTLKVILSLSLSLSLSLW